MLRDLHAVLRSYSRSEPTLAPMADIPALLARQTLLSVADVSVLSETFTRLTEDLAGAGGPGQVLHEDAGLSNLRQRTVGGSGSTLRTPAAAPWPGTSPRQPQARA